GTPIAGEIPETPGPFAALFVDNAAGTKLDYYLDRSLTYTAPSCSEDPRRSTITVRLTNDAPLHGLPAYVRFRPDINPNLVEKVPQNHVVVFVYATRRAGLLGSTLDGRAVDVSSGRGRGHSVFKLDLVLNPQKTATLTLHLAEPA